MGLEYVYAALLLHELGKSPSEEDISNVLKAAGVEPDAARVKQLVEALGKVDLDELISKATAAPVVATPATAPPSAESKEEKKEEEEKEEEEKEEVALEGLGALFG